MQRQLTKRLGGRNGLAATLLVLFSTIVILVPVLTYVVLISQQALEFIDWMRPHLQPQEFARFWHDTLPQRYPQVMAWVRELSGGEGMTAASSTLQGLLGLANAGVQTILARVAEALLDLVIFLMMLFFLLRDGGELRDAARGISPLTRGQETELLDHLTRTVKGVVQSMVAVPLAQGAAAFVGFVIFGVPRPLLWSVMVVFAALIPLVGSPLAWVPAGLYLYFTRSHASGIGFLVYGAVVISTTDNIIKPLILKGAAQIHIMLGFLSVLGGLYAFGPKGLIAGPVILSLVVSAYRIYRYDVLHWREDEAGPPSSKPALRSVP